MWGWGPEIFHIYDRLNQIEIVGNSFGFNDYITMTKFELILKPAHINATPTKKTHGILWFEY